MRVGSIKRAQHPALARRTRRRWVQDSPKCFTLGWPVFAPALINTGHRLGRLAKFSHGVHARNVDSNLYPNPARPRSGPTKFWGTRLGLGSVPQGERALSCAQRLRVPRHECRVLRPQAEFARSSGRCLRRVHNFVQAEKGMCKKIASFLINRVKTRYKSPTPNPENSFILCVLLPFGELYLYPW